MPRRSWTIPIENGRWIAVRMEFDSGQICSFAVVLIVEIDSEPHCATRYDNAHGQPHRDILGIKQGLIRKDWLVDLTNKDALNYAIDNLRVNHETYIQFFLSR